MSVLGPKNADLGSFYLVNSGFGGDLHMKNVFFWGGLYIKNRVFKTISRFFFFLGNL
jgi:hypothetical protein